MHGIHQTKRPARVPEVALCLHLIPACLGILLGCEKPAGVVPPFDSSGRLDSLQAKEKTGHLKGSAENDIENGTARPLPAAVGVAISNQGDEAIHRELLQHLIAQFDIQVTVEGRHDQSYFESRDICGCPASSEQLAQFIPLLAQELDIYGRKLIKAINLRRIHLSTELTHNDQPVAGVCGPETIYLNVRLSSTHARRTIHHELFHMLDRLNARMQSDLVWKELNPPSFVYTEVIPTTRMWNLYTADSGFVTEYSTTSISEDKAETYALMITFPKLVSASIQRDDIVAHKVAHIESRISAICDAEDDQFWKRVEAIHESSDGHHKSMLTVYLANETSDIFGLSDGIEISGSAFQKLRTSTTQYELDSLFRASAECGERPTHELKLNASESKHILLTRGCRISSPNIASSLITEISETRAVVPPFYVDVAADGTNVYLQITRPADILLFLNK